MNRQVCPFVERPFEECFCYSLSSSQVRQALHFCACHFQECFIYMKKSAGQSKGVHQKMLPNP